MALYNTTWLNSSNTLYDISIGVNTVTDGYFFTIINYLILLVIIVNFKRWDSPQAVYAATIMNLIISGMFYIIGLVGDAVLGVNILLVLLSTVYWWFYG